MAATLEAKVRIRTGVELLAALGPEAPIFCRQLRNRSATLAMRSFRFANPDFARAQRDC